MGKVLKLDKQFNTVFYLNVIWLYAKYQLLTKTLVVVLLFPSFKWVVNRLLLSTGRSSISSGDYLPFLFSVQGVGLMFMALVLLVFFIAIDINAFIIMSALIQENKMQWRASYLLKVSLYSLKSLIKPSGIGIMLYTACIVPLLGLSFTISITEQFKIPNFITAVILKNPLYLALYGFVLTLFTFLTLIYIFFFHYLIIDQQGIQQALQKSAQLMKRHWKSFLKTFILKIGGIFVALFALLSFVMLVILLYLERLPSIFMRRWLTLFLTLSLQEILSLIALLSVPFVCFVLTHLFYAFNQKDQYPLSIQVPFMNAIYEAPKSFEILKRISLMFGLLLFFFNFSLTLGLAYFFEEVFYPSKTIELIAHRAGGDLAAENSLLGMQKAYALGANYSEIDVQRTKDGAYIIQHDKTFSRVSNLNLPSHKLTLSEIKALNIKDLFDSSRPSQKVATLEEFLQEAQGKIGLFIELKGYTADFQMVEDVVRMVKERGMEKDIALLSLNYTLIEYIEERYPEIKTGYLYFFSLGDIENLKADLFIMEESEASRKKINEIHKVGKKAIVWTVNKEDSIDKFIRSDADGIITDVVLKVKEKIKAKEQQNDVQALLNFIFH